MGLTPPRAYGLADDYLDCLRLTGRTGITGIDEYLAYRQQWEAAQQARMLPYLLDDDQRAGE